MKRIAFWLEPLAEQLARLKSTPEGLSQQAAREALAQFGPNHLQGGEQAGALRLLASIFANPLVLLLVGASAVSAGVGDSTNASIIVVIVLLSATLEFFQSYRSSQAARKLQDSVATRATVLRDGQPVEIPLEDVVPGDVVVLSAGSLVPGDARVLSSKELCAGEAALTGESLPANKHAGELSPQATSLSQAENAVFMGTSIVSGMGRVLVVSTGLQTEFGKVASNLLGKKPTTEFEHGIHAYGMFILRTVIALVGFVLLTNILFHRPALEALLFSIALAVGLTPEFLPMIISVSLAAGAVRLARSRVIVKRLASIENLGSIDILCSDKTGTLTLGKIELEHCVDFAGDTLPYLAANSALQSGIQSPMDAAVLAKVGACDASFVKIDELPFDFQRRRLSVVVDAAEGRMLVCKGAPESIVPLCLGVDEVAFRKTFEDLSRDGYRVLAVATRALDNRAEYALSDECEMTLVGLAAFLDPARPDARQTLAALKASGVCVKILTGDNELVSRKICADVGLDVEEMLLGGDLDAMSDTALGALAEKATVFARLSPSQKNRVMTLLRKRGHVVGYLGDGINDAPSLQTADIGISVENAVDVAKESADIILLDPGLEAVHKGILEGRRSFGNIMKYILMGTSSNFGNMFSMAGASLLLPFLPLLPAQLLLNNLLYDLSQVAIPADHVDDAYVRGPRRWDTALIRRFMVVLGPISSLFDFLTFYVLLKVLHANEALFHTGWFVESLFTQVLVIFVIRTDGPPWKSRPHPALLGGALASVLVGLLLPYSPLAQRLGFVPLPAEFFLFLLAATAVYLGLVEAVKRYFYR